MSQKLLEKYYTVEQLKFAFEYNEKTIRRKIEAGEFGKDVLKLNGNDWRVPMSGVLFFQDNNRIFQREDSVDLTPTCARTEGELRRRISMRATEEKQ